MAVALRAVEAVCDSKTSFNSLCYCLTLPSVNAHPDFSDWTPHLGRQRAYTAVRRELEGVFPGGVGAGGREGAGGAPQGQLVRLLCQAAGAQACARAAADPRLLGVRIT